MTIAVCLEALNSIVEALQCLLVVDSPGVQALVGASGLHEFLQPCVHR